MRFGPLRLALGALITLLVAGLTIFAVSPPPVRGADAPLTEFSATRALVHVEAIAKKPHPVGSPAHEEVRAYILHALEGMGIEARVQDTSAAIWAAAVTHAAHLTNVIARLPGRNHGPAVLLSAHYDSVPNSRGASDDGSGVATLLEAARALKAGPPLDNDVLFVFTDAEENAMCGALAFTEEELEKTPVGVALNFEARGTRGAVALYDTSEANGALIHAVSAVVPRVVSTSLLGSLAKILPNDTDASLWKRAGIPTYAFAYVDHFYQYHQFTDSVASLDPRSLQHDGDYALPLARYFGSTPLPLSDAGEVVYFDVFGRWVVSYSTSAARVLAILTLGLVGYLFWQRQREGEVKLVSAVVGGLLGISALTFAVGGAWLAHSSLSHALDPLVLSAHPEIACIAGCVIALAGFLMVLRTRLAPIHVVGATFGGLGLFGVALALLAVVAPAASFVFQWPLLFAAGGTAVWLRFRGEGGPRVDAAVTLMMVPAAFFWSYLAYTIFVMVGGASPELVALCAVAPLVLAIPFFEQLGITRVRVISAGAAATSVAIAVAGALSVGSRDLPHPDNLEYSIEGSHKITRWSSNDLVHDAYVSQRVGEGQHSVKAESYDVPPFVTKSQVVDDGELRHGTLRLTSARHARCVRMWELSKDTISKVRINDKEVVELIRFSAEFDEKLMRWHSGGGRQADWVLEYCGDLDKGMKLDIEWPKSGKVMKIRVTEIADGLPGPALTPRTPTDGYPDSTSDQTSITSDISMQ
jgi:hypothetical protein